MSEVVSNVMELSPILWTQNGTGVAVLTRAVPKTDGDDRSWDLDFWVDISAKEEAAGLSSNFPAAGAYYDAAVNEVATADLKIKPLKGQRCHVTIRLGDGSSVVDDQAAEVRFIKITANTNVRGQGAKIKLHGVGVDESNAIVGALGQRVSVMVAQDQGQLFIAGEADVPEIGQLLTGKDQSGNIVAGLMIRDEDGRTVIDDFGVVYTLDAISGQVVVESSDAHSVEDHGGRYRESVEAMDSSPTWSVVVEAVGRVWAADDNQVQQPTATTLYINEAVIDAAIGLHVERPESGSVAGV